MSEKNSFLLRAVVLLLLLVVIISGAYSFAHRYVVNYHTPKGEDVTLSSMEQDTFTAFPDGKSLITGTFLANDDAFKNKSIYVKAYDASGFCQNTYSMALPEGYANTDIITASDRVFLLYSAPTGVTEGAKVYEILSDGTLFSEKELVLPNTGIKSKDIHILYGGEELSYGLYSANEVMIYNLDGEIISSISLMPEVEVVNVEKTGDIYCVLGRIKGGASYSAYYGTFSKDGTQLYSVSAMTDYISVATKFIPLISSSNEVAEALVCGFYFNEEEYLSSYPKTPATLTAEQLSSLAESSISNAQANRGSVLLSNEYYDKPWCSMFILKIDAEGKITKTLSPISTSSTSGISYVSYPVSTPDKAESGGKVPIITVTSSVAVNKSSNSYQTNVYDIYSDLTMSSSVNLNVNADIKTDCTSNSEDKLFVYTAINRKEYSSLHIYDDISAYAEDLTKLNLSHSAIEYIEDSLKVLPMLAVFLILVITMRYSYFDYKQKARVIYE